MKKVVLVTVVMLVISMGMSSVYGDVMHDATSVDTKEGLGKVITSPPGCPLNER